MPACDPYALARALDAPPPRFLARDSWFILKPRHARPLAGTREFEALWASHPDSFLTFRAPGGGATVPYPRWARAYGVSYAFSGQVATAARVVREAGALFIACAKARSNEGKGLRLELGFGLIATEHRRGVRRTTIDDRPPPHAHSEGPA